MNSLTFEITLKPFYGLDDAATRAKCREALSQWQSLARRAETLSIMLWVADGSEILEYTGKLDDPMEWARYLGNANPHMPVPADPEGKSLHARNYLYREDAKLLTYGRLADIVQAWRDVASEQNLSIQIGATFDPGGEFAPSDFKYKRHREICLSNTMGKASFVCCYATLNADNHPYAGFPNGIPQGLSLGSFLGAQFRRFAQDLNFDFLWFSNGFGFGQETWKTIGPLFDGESFHPEKAPELSDRIQNFWHDFRRECPKHPIRVRGTNLGTATDLASDATPLRELYAGGFNFEPPPNSPWASINGDFGIELAGYQGRIAELPPGKNFSFRFYLHDPWWLNSPWIDRYEGQPHDIYMPLAISRVDGGGSVEAASGMHLFTLDDSYGKMPDRVPNESVPHLLRAWEQRPDAAGPIVWLYPFDEAHDELQSKSPSPERLFHIDWFAREALNNGVPLNTVVSTRAFDQLRGTEKNPLVGRLLVSPTPLAASGEARLLRWLESGGSLVLYGPLDQAPTLRKRLGLEPAEPIDGEFEVQNTAASIDRFPVLDSSRFTHRTVMSGGGLSEKPSPFSECFAIAERGEHRRSLAAEIVTPEGGRLSWLRGPLPLKVSMEAHLPTPDAPETTFPLATLLRQALASHGWRIGLGAASRSQRAPVITVHRHSNGWFYSGYMPDTTVEMSLKTPYGAPLLIGCETVLDDGAAKYRFPRAWRHECRIFVEQQSGVVSTVEDCPAQVGVTRRLRVSGLTEAIARFFPPDGASSVTLWDNPQWPHIGGERVPLQIIETPDGAVLETRRPVSGTVLFSW